MFRGVGASTASVMPYGRWSAAIGDLIVAGRTSLSETSLAHIYRILNVLDAQVRQHPLRDSIEAAQKRVPPKSAIPWLNSGNKFSLIFFSALKLAIFFFTTTSSSVKPQTNCRCYGRRETIHTVSDFSCNLSPIHFYDDCKGSDMAFQEKSQMRTPCLFTQLFLLKEVFATNRFML